MLTGDGDSPPSLRERVAQNVRAITCGDRERAEGLPEPLAELVHKLAKHAYQVVDEDIEALVAAGYSDNALYELIVSGAVAAASQRLEIALAALAEVEP